MLLFNIIMYTSEPVRVGGVGGGAVEHVAEASHHAQLAAQHRVEDKEDAAGSGGGGGNDSGGGGAVRLLRLARGVTHDAAAERESD